MKERKLTESESLELITLMIKNARTHLRAKINGNILLIWGYATVITSLLVGGLKKYTAYPYASLFWLLIPLVCYPVTRYLSAKENVKIKSYLDKVIHSISLLNILVCMTMVMPALWLPFPILFIEGILLHMWIIIIGLLIRYKAILWGGIMGILVSGSLLFIPGEINQIFIFALIPLFSVILPGYLFKKNIFINV